MRFTSTRSFFAVLAALSLSLTAACTIDRGNSQTADSQAGDNQDKPKAELTASVKDNATKVKVDDTISISSKLPMDSAAIVNSDGKEMEGHFNADKTEWTLGQKLGYSRDYTIRAKAGEDTLRRTFTTMTPDAQSGAALAPLDGATVGVGQTIALRFDSAVEDREAVEKAVKIKTEPAVEGAFYWISNQEVRWRPKEYWAPGTTVTVNANLYGTKIGEGVYGSQDSSATFTIGDDVRAVVDDAKKTMTVTKNGQPIKTMPVSNGRDGGRWATPNGTYMVGDQHPSIVMDSNTFGLPESQGGYVADVKNATQLSYSGIYIHSAPWSVWAQGSQNTSHGCINVSPDNAQWVMNNLKRGDIVKVVNSSGSTLPGTDGLGDWNIDWETWKQGNAQQ